MSIRLSSTVLVALLLVTGCSATTPAPHPSPPPSTPHPSLPPPTPNSPDATVSYVPLEPSPADDLTVDPHSGRTLRVIAAPDHLSVRALKAKERKVLTLVSHVATGMADPVAVDIGEGYAFVGFWSGSAGNRGPEPEYVLVHSSGEHLSTPLGSTWQGRYALRSIAFTAGREAADLAREAIGADEVYYWPAGGRPEPDWACTTVPRSALLRAQQTARVTFDVTPQPGEGTYVDGGLDRTGTPWRMVAIGTTTGPQTVVWRLPRGGADVNLDDSVAFGKFIPVSTAWDGNLAESEGPLTWGLEARTAALRCLGD